MLRSYSSGSHSGFIPAGSQGMYREHMMLTRQMFYLLYCISSPLFHYYKNQGTFQQYIKVTSNYQLFDFLGICPDIIMKQYRIWEMWKAINSKEMFKTFIKCFLEVKKLLHFIKTINHGFLPLILEACPSFLQSPNHLRQILPGQIL